MAAAGVFNGAPNYGEILSANKNSVEPPKLNELFKLKNNDWRIWYAVVEDVRSEITEVKRGFVPG